jgi:hypothetical protein
LVEHLDRLLEDFKGDALNGWTQEQLGSLLSVLGTLEVEARAVQLAFQALEARAEH